MPSARLTEARTTPPARPPHPRPPQSLSKSTQILRKNQTQEHARKVELVFECFDRKARAKTCEATVGLLKEGEEMAASFEGSPAINAALIAAAQKVEHYEMATYGCLREWAALLGNKKAAGLLQEILDEEGDTNKALTAMARSTSNEGAMGEEEKKPSTSSRAKAKA